MIVQGHNQPSAPTSHKPTPNKGPGRPSAPSKPSKPAGHKPAGPSKPSKPNKPSPPGKKTAGRGEIDFTWLDEVPFAPLAKTEHIH